MGKRQRIKNIIWDFDGVIVESNHIREEGFRQVLSDFPKSEIDVLLDFHNKNGGLSRYVKFRYFFEIVRSEQVSNEKVQDYANRFSAIMRELMTSPEILIEETNNFIKKMYNNYNFHIASGSDQNELRYLCKELKIAKYFKSIKGSPTPKNEIVKNLLREWKYEKNKTILIGDAINDFEAASSNGIYFMAYNGSDELQRKSTLGFNLT